MVHLLVGGVLAGGREQELGTVLPDCRQNSFRDCSRISLRNWHPQEVNRVPEQRGDMQAQQAARLAVEEPLFN
jgi:hypothetical protein